MLALGVHGVVVSSPKLLRRLESKNVIVEPPECERPKLPSARKWGGKRGYCYVTKKLIPEAFDFEGSRYRFVEEKGKTYLYKLNGNLKIQ